MGDNDQGSIKMDQHTLTDSPGSWTLDEYTCNETKVPN